MKDSIIKISAIILARDEEKNVEKAIKSVDFADEILVIDDNSEDKTKLVAQRMGARVVEHALNYDFAAQRNFGQAEAKGQWLLYLDADEVLSKELQGEIKSITDYDESHTAFYIPRRDFMWGTELKYGETRKARTQGIIRLVKKGSGLWTGKVHEEWTGEGKKMHLSHFINHYPHQSVRDFLQSINWYSTLRALELYKNKEQVKSFELFFKPLVKFIYTYFFLFGFIDGPAGFLYSFMMSFHSFLVRAKLYQFIKIDTNSKIKE
ncbi:glycosyltransferase family 2 protein [Candidatus Roizmanbacteria bacterium]|nr:glycosyltransferase family 2 protein [Candidatus Roizmanbacteria bacterium]